MEVVITLVELRGLSSSIRRYIMEVVITLVELKRT